MSNLWEEFLTQMNSRKERMLKDAEQDNAPLPQSVAKEPEIKLPQDVSEIKLPQESVEIKQPQESVEIKQPQESPVVQQFSDESRERILQKLREVGAQEAAAGRAEQSEHVPSLHQAAGQTAGIEGAQERTERKVGQDFLLSQIDEFREKAKQLQELMASKENKARELQSIVSEREGKAQELEQILTERQEAANGLLSDFNDKVDLLANRVTEKISEIETNISRQVAETKVANEEQLERTRRLNEEQIVANRQFFEEQSSKNKQIFEEQLDNNRQFLQEQTIENKKLFDDQMATIKKSLEEQAIANKKLSEGQIAEVKNLLETSLPQLESLKTDLSEKVHSENVKCYRNIQDLFTEFDSKIEKMDTMEKDVGSMKKYIRFLTGFSIVDIVTLIVVLLFVLGIL